ncbi:MAG TPA: NADH:ubiquinone reductase (Na(+)-transporting) subunit A, partial [Saprospiraceae bacterium]|nr:NADH:ubiquinone reductase (Na(+)-transporting) subunit A [Saprospiraceae bacterium]
MRTKINRFFLLFLFSNFAFAASAQSSTGGSSSLMIVLAVIVITILGAIIMVANSLLKEEANELGVNKKGILPRMSEFFGGVTPSYVDGDVTFLKKGYDILLEGEAEKTTSHSSATAYAVLPPNFEGMSPIPKVVVSVGDEVKAGDVLFFDKKRPDIQYVAPVSGEIAAINRGAKRSISQVVILADKEMKYRTFDVPDLTTCS